VFRFYRRCNSAIIRPGPNKSASNNPNGRTGIPVCPRCGLGRLLKKWSPVHRKNKTIHESTRSVSN
jgi:hypothetical protein